MHANNYLLNCHTLKGACVYQSESLGGDAEMCESTEIVAGDVPCGFFGLVLFQWPS